LSSEFGRLLEKDFWKMLRVVLLLVALAAGGIAAWLVFAARPQPAAATTIVEPAPEVPLQDVLVASSDLLPAQAITQETLRWQAWPPSALNPVYITRSSRPDALNALAGSVVRNRISVGEPIREQNLIPRHAGFLATILPAGKRAMAVRTSAESTAGGFIKPNDRVDVLHSDGQAHVSSTILRNVRVLAIDTLVDDTSKDENIKANAIVIGKTATLELDPSQAEVLTAAQATGTLSLSLRSAADNGDYRQQDRQTVRIIRAGRTEIVKSQ
jgi:pilus assembly protein CpaB